MKTAIVLAGGLGTRLRDAVPDFPKPMASVAGRPFLEYVLDYWIAQGVSRFILSVGYRAELIQNHFGGQYHEAVIDYAVENVPLGTGGGLLLAAARLSQTAPFVLLNGDTFFEVDLAALEVFHAALRAGWTFSLFPTSETGRYMGLDVAPDGRVRSLRSGDSRPGGNGVLANGGVYLVDPASLLRAGFKAGDKVSLEDELLPAFRAAGGTLAAMQSDGQFIDIGVPEDYYRAAALLAPGHDGTMNQL